jgi:hypothetical protein
MVVEKGILRLLPMGTLMGFGVQNVGVWYTQRREETTEDNKSNQSEPGTGRPLGPSRGRGNEFCFYR